MEPSEVFQKAEPIKSFTVTALIPKREVFALRLDPDEVHSMWPFHGKSIQTDIMPFAPVFTKAFVAFMNGMYYGAIDSEAAYRNTTVIFSDAPKYDECYATMRFDRR